MSIYETSAHMVSTLLAIGPPLILAITIHEASHGYVAYLLGDDTAKTNGRMTLNPLKHIDPIGTIAIPLSLFLGMTILKIQHIIFGWAKPVPVTQSRLKSPKRDFAIVSAAGPIANIIMAIFWAIIVIALNNPPSLEAFISSLTLAIWNNNQHLSLLSYMAHFGVLINTIFAAINLLPIPPLDGANIVAAFLSKRSHAIYMSLAPIGVWLVLGLLISGALWGVIKVINLNILNLVYYLATQCVRLIDLIPTI
ncbi:MAG: site-2 protease family protein [Candidatus Comchoanobacterales bacterium]